MKTLSLKVPETLDGDLEALAVERGVSKSALIRETLVELTRKQRPTARRSAFALVEDLVGCVEGPEDLATNPSHLDDFGR